MSKPKRPLDEKIVKAIRETARMVGRLYPVLVTPDGEVIDGYHRKAADPEWPERTVDAVTEEGRALVWIAAHTRRGWRDPAFREEFRRRMEALGRWAADHYGLDPKRGEVVKFLVSLTGYSDRYIQSFLPEDLKAPTRPKPKRVEMISTPEVPKVEAEVKERPAEAAERPKRRVPEAFAKPIGVYCHRAIGIGQHIECLEGQRDEILAALKLEDESARRRFLWDIVSRRNQEIKRWKGRRRRGRAKTAG